MNSSGARANRAIRKKPPAIRIGGPRRVLEAALNDTRQTDCRRPRSMSEPSGPSLSPYHHFTRDEWAALRADTPLTLTIDDLKRLQSLNDPISLEEVIAIYLPLSRLLALYVAATQGLFKATQRFLGADDGKMPYIIGVAGSVAVGKSTTARVLQALLSRWPNTPKVELVTTDGFLLPNADAGARRPDGPEGLSGKLRRRRAAALPVRRQGRPRAMSRRRSIRI